MKKVLLIMILLMPLLLLAANDFSIDKKRLSHEMDKAEQELMQFYQSPLYRTDPPATPVRAIAEYEPMTDVIVSYSYGFGIPVSLIADFTQEINVVIIIEYSYQESTVLNLLDDYEFNEDNIEFLVAPVDSYWVRDYGPWFVEYGTGNIGIVNFDYNRPRPNDDEIPNTFSQEYDYDYFHMALVQTGGNYMADGMGVAAQSHIAYTENSDMTEDEVDQMMEDYLGITDYHVVDDPNGEYINHIDCWGKFLAPDKLLLREVPSYHSQYDEIEAVADYFANQTSSYGTPYEIYRVNTPNDQPYTNSLILNNRVFVPQVNSTHDQVAIEVYQEAMPGYEIIGVYDDDCPSWMGTDALHCRTHEVADKEMLRIYHLPLNGTIAHDEAIEVEADIKAMSGEELIADSLLVYYTLNDQEMLYSTLLENDQASEFSAELDLPAGAKIQYYVHAVDASGRVENHPYIGQADAHVFYIENDQTIINHEQLTDMAADEFPLSFVAEVIDESGISEVTLEYKINDGESQYLIMNLSEENLYTAQWDLTAELNDTISYRITATDAAYEPLTTNLPEEGYYQFIIDAVANENDSSEITSSYLMGNYPNPFNPNTTIKFYLQEKTDVSAIIYDIKGRTVKKFVNNEYEKGIHKIEWDGTDNKGEVIGTGMYFLRIKLGDQYHKQKMLLLK